MRAKLTSLALVITLEDGEFIDCKAVTVACVFVIFLCQCGFLSSFSPLRVLPLSQPHGFCEKSA